MIRNSKRVLNVDYDFIDGGAKNIFKTNDDLLIFDLKLEEAKYHNQSNKLLKAVFNGNKCWVKRIGIECVEDIMNEDLIQKHNLSNTLRFHDALHTDSHIYLIYRDHFLTLAQFLKNANWNSYICKSTLHKFCTVMMYFYNKGLCYRNINVFKDIFVEIGAFDFSLKIDNVLCLDTDLDETEYIDAFVSLVYDIYSAGKPRTNDSEQLFKGSRDRFTILDLLNQIQLKTITTYRGILCHPYFWKDRKIIEFINRVYLLANRENPVIDLNSSKYASYYNKWCLDLDESIKNDALTTSEWASNKPGGLRLKDVDVNTLSGLVSYTRNSCGAHFSYSINARRRLGNSPSCINEFLYTFPHFLIELYTITMTRSQAILSKQSAYKHNSYVAEEISMKLDGFLPED